MASLPSIDSLREEVQPLLDRATSSEELEGLRIAWLGRKGRLTLLLKQLGSLPLEEKKVYGPQDNQLKSTLEETLLVKENSLAGAERSRKLEKDALDTSLPGVPVAYGHTHPLSQVTESLISIFRVMGFVVADGPEIETEFYNFEALNIPANHPARDMQDTFYLAQSSELRTQKELSEPRDLSSEMTLLRTHTSPVQIRVMQKYPPPVAVVVPGRVYRHEAMDATHSAIFHQLEGLLVDEKVSFADLKGTLSRFVHSFFGPAVKTRFRPSYFPFTEPSAEMDISCLLCAGGGCSVCKQSGWVEVMGAGMVHPNVMAAVKMDAEKYTGFAFGMGIERLAIIKYGVDDMRLFFENDVRFLNQF